MIRRVVDFALDNRLLVLGFAVLLFAGGIVAFRDLPIEAYPDVADNYVEIITQWPGISAEQIEQQVTIPLEIVMNGIPHVVHLRSFSLFGLSDIKLIFDDESDNDWNRERVLERLSQVALPPGVNLSLIHIFPPATSRSPRNIRKPAARIPPRLPGSGSGPRLRSRSLRFRRFRSGCGSGCVQKPQIHRRWSFSVRAGSAWVATMAGTKMARQVAPTHSR